MSILAPPLTGGPLSITSALPPDRAIGSLWRRIVAFVVDGVIVGIAGSVVALPFFETFSRLGPWGRVVGFCLALPYFAILNSKTGNGQTLGKRLLHLQVVDKNGNTISFGRSVVRYTAFAVPYYLDDLLLPTSRTPWIMSTLLSVVIYGVGVCTFYLILFNRHTRQGIHDLAAGSYVADGDKNGPLKVQPIWRAHWVILGSLLIVIALGTKIVGNKLMKWGPFPQLLEDVRLVEAMEGVQAAGAQDLNSNLWGREKAKKTLVINVFWSGKSESEQVFAYRVAKLILQNDVKVGEYDSLKIVINRGYDLGIAHARISHYYEHTPAEWHTRLFGSSSVGEQAPNKS